MNESLPNLRPVIRPSRDTWVVWLLCALAAVHVFVYSAAFPFFNNMDEECHFDLAVKYSQNHIPRQLEHFSEESIPYLAYFGTLEYFPARPGAPMPPPPWTLPKDQALSYLQNMNAAAHTSINYESTQAPFYYVLAGAFWRAISVLNLDGGTALYLLRFVNILIVVGLVWLAHVVARMFFPEHTLVRLGVPAVMAFMPQSAFYSIENDVLSPITFGVAFMCLQRWLRGDRLTIRLAACTGLALAASVLTKVNNLPLAMTAAGVVVLKGWREIKSEQGRSAVPGLMTLCVCAGLPVATWLIWNRETVGDFTGSAGKISFLTWTYKPFRDWWHHPIFSVTGSWTFLSRLFSTLWQGEMIWHGSPLSNPSVSLIYSLLTVVALAIVSGTLLLRPASLSPFQRMGLWFSLGCLLANIVFLAFISLIFDFHDCVYPSREQPYFSSGRLMLGAAVPFLLLVLAGLNLAAGRMRSGRIGGWVLGGLILFMLVTEAAANWPVYTSEFNWYHM